MVVSCPAGGGACVVTVAADGTASYHRTGGTPGVMAAYGPWTLPANHGLRADFTELQSWAAGTAPGTLGTGSQWSTGSLGYTITVGGNYLRSTGGDDGTVNGQFYGVDHEGVAGSLERDDLTAAFGATRN